MLLKFELSEIGHWLDQTNFVQAVYDFGKSEVRNFRGYLLPIFCITATSITFTFDDSFPLHLHVQRQLFTPPSRPTTGFFRSSCPVPKQPWVTTDASLAVNNFHLFHKCDLIRHRLVTLRPQMIWRGTESKQFSITRTQLIWNRAGSKQFNEIRNSHYHRFQNPPLQTLTL